MKNEIGWYEKHIDSWYEFTSLLDEIVKPLAGQRHHFFYRGQVCKDWRLESSLFRQFESRESRNDKLPLPRCFEIEQDAKREFESQLHLHMDPAGLPDTKDWLGWWALMQHYGAPTRLLDWTTSPFVAAYFAVEPFNQSDGLIWVLNDWALGDRMTEQYSDAWSKWDESLTRPSNNWSKVMNITANSLFPGVDGLGRSVREFIQIEVAHDKPGSSHPLP